MATGLDDSLTEIEAMRSVAEAVQPLGSDARARVLRWACERFDVSVGVPPKKVLTGGGSFSDAMASAPLQPMNAPSEFETAAELLAAAQPQSEAEKALVIGYWFQVVLGQSDIEAQAVNTELKHQGHGASNITRALGVLISQKPQPVIQVRKAGTSKQARKKYKLTTVGIHQVRRMLEGIRPGIDNNGNGEE